MAPIVGVFAVAAVAGFGATLGHRVARDLVVPLAGAAAGATEEAWAKVTAWAEENRRRDYAEFAEPPDTAGA